MSTVRSDVVNLELLSLTYGAIVTQVIRDYEDVQEVNAQLDQMGFNIGIRLVDEFCAKSRAVKCKSFREAVETLCRDAFKMFLGIQCVAENWNQEYSSCTIRIPDNPLSDFVELPHSYADLRYSNIICGVIRGAFNSLRLKVDVYFVKDVLNGDDTTELMISLKEIFDVVAGRDYQDE